MIPDPSTMLYLGIGSLVGLISGMFGVGGGFLLVPLLNSTGMPMHLALGTTLFAISLGGFTGAYKHLQEGNVHVGAAPVFGLSAIVGAQVGSYLACLASEHVLKVALGVACSAMALRMAFDGEIEEKNEIRDNTVIASLTGFGVGAFSGFTGSGGGVLFVPVMASILNFPTMIAVGTSSVIVPISALAGVAQYWMEGYVNFWAALAVVVGMLMSSYVGAELSNKIGGEKVKRAFSVVLAIVGAKMTLNGLLLA
ncbi:sulfite exporter TauE/SafE family protein [Methanopyrus sp. KOL6]|uniref:sulfite exporter TauE/SafE family protein n=1 Tax=Methanopyrus sp. KOL6 TaxID=1937004 RepID=UPI000B4B2DB8|nr:sulfite exporter TauE/SafE family protein [Methanopyrus sp. KOL6]